MQINNIRNTMTDTEYARVKASEGQQNTNDSKTTKTIDSSENVGVIYNRSEYENSGIYTSNGVLVTTSGEAVNRIFQNNLKILGFYDVEAPSDGNLGSAESMRAISNFQRVYGLQVNGGSNSETRAKLNEVMDFYNSLSSADLSGIAGYMSGYSDYYLPIESTNIKSTWTFLRKGMGLNQVQAAGVMGNLLQESGLSPNNAQDSYMHTHKLRDTSYTYSSSDGIGYGIMQWTYSTRKQGLANMASTMGSSVSDRNVQFAFMRKELETSFSRAWTQIKNSNDIDFVTKKFRSDIEGCGSASDNTRLTKANTVYNALKNY